MKMSVTGSTLARRSRKNTYYDERVVTWLFREYHFRALLAIAGSLGHDFDLIKILEHNLAGFIESTSVVEQRDPAKTNHAVGLIIFDQ